MRVLVIGGGGREHALAWKLSREAGVTALFCAPGNAGIARRRARADRSPAIRTRCSRSPSASDRSHRRRPELPLDRGVVDRFRAAAAASSAAARGRAARVQQGVREGLHGAARHSDRALSRVRIRGGARERDRVGRVRFPVVLKADGLAAGRASSSRPIARSRRARSAPRWKTRSSAPPARAGHRGMSRRPEVSFFALCDGHSR
jgi:phosphoribosylamine--glycine ligase